MSKEEEGKFRCNPDGFTAGKGFTMTFANGNTVSVQWHQGSYSDGRTDAEIAAWTSRGWWHQFPEGDKVKGWVRSDEVAEFIQWVASNELNIGEKKR